MNSFENFLRQVFLRNRSELLVAHHAAKNLVIAVHSLDEQVV